MHQRWHEETLLHHLGRCTDSLVSLTPNPHLQLFAELPLQRFLITFSLINFAPGKLPEAATLLRLLEMRRIEAQISGRPHRPGPLMKRMI
jgi:hypothetical protein